MSQPSCVFNNGTGDNGPEGPDSTDQGTSASLLESACGPEPYKGVEGEQEGADQGMHVTKMAPTLVTTCTQLRQHVTPEVSTSIRKALWEDLGKKEKVSCIKDAVL